MQTCRLNFLRPHRVQVNKIREVPGHSDVVVTHSDSKELYVWHTERQPSRPQALQVLPHVALRCLGRGAFPDNCAAADSGVDYKGYLILHPMLNSSRPRVVAQASAEGASSCYVAVIG